MGSAMALTAFVVLLLCGTAVRGQLTADELERRREAALLKAAQRAAQQGGSAGTVISSSGGDAQAATATFNPIASQGGDSGGGDSGGSGGSSSGLLSGGSGGSGSGRQSGQFGMVLGGSSDSRGGSSGILSGGQGNDNNDNNDNSRRGGRPCRGGSGSGLLGSSNGCADPIMTGFGGRSFNFIGEADKTYNLISSKNHQMSAKLQFAHMWDHNGTTMSGIAVMYKDYKVLMEIEGDTAKVFVQDKPLAEKTRAQRHAWRFDDGTAVEMEWDRFRPSLGNSVVVTTDMLKVMMWHTPKGIIDEGGVMLDGYLNFNVTLLAPPVNNVMSGIIGDTYERFTVGQTAFTPNSTYYLPDDEVWYGKGETKDYEMANYWDTNFKMNTFGMDIEEIRSRSSLETDSVQLAELPAYASFGTVPLLADEQQVASAAEAVAVLRLRRLLLA